MDTPVAPADAESLPPGLSSDDAEYWFALIDEKEAADFYDVEPRSMQNWRQDGTGPPFIRLSARAIKYTRWLLRTHYEAKIRKSTSDPDPEAEAA